MDQPKIYTRSLDISEDSIDKENRILRNVVMATDTPVLTFNWRIGQLFYEVLGFDASKVNLTRANNGAPVLDNHNRYDGSEGVRGNIIRSSAKIEESKRLVGDLQFARTADTDTLWTKVSDGNIRTFSIGYDVDPTSYVDITPEADKNRKGVYPTYRADKWELRELSVAPIPADPNALARAYNEEIEKTKITNQNQTRAMADNKPEGAAAPTEAELQARDKQTRETTLKEHKQRITEITNLVRMAALPDAEKRIAAYIESDDSLDTIRAAVQKEWATKEPTVQNHQTVEVKGEERDIKGNALADAMLIRAGIIPDDPKNQYRGYDLREIAAESLRLDGVKTEGMNKMEISSRVFQQRAGEMTTSDFVNILANVQNKLLRKNLEAKPQSFKEWTKMGTLPDFKPGRRILMGSIAAAPRIAKDGEYTRQGFGDASEPVQLETYGYIIPLSRMAIVNDDLSAFTRTPMIALQSFQQTESNEVYSGINGLLTNPKLVNDGLVVFENTKHKNLISSATALGLTGLDAASQLMWVQTGLDGKTQLNLEPVYLIVGPKNKQAAYQYTSASYQPVVQGGIMPEYISRLKVIVDSRITTYDWYLACSPDQCDTIETNYLEGTSGVYMEQRMGWNSDGIELKCRLDFQAKILDYRGLVKVVGAAPTFTS